MSNFHTNGQAANGSKLIKSNYDSFGRVRVSQPLTIFDRTHTSDQSLFFTTGSSGALANSTVRDVNKSAMILTCDTGSSDYVLYQTKRHFRYQPSKSQLIFTTFNFNELKTGANKRVGYYNDYNGIYLELSGTVPYFVVRSDVSGDIVNNKVPQSSWNISTLDFLDFTKVQILIIDFEWLGVGSVRAGFVVDGNIYYAHQFNHANIKNTVYMRTPYLPIRWEIRNTEQTDAATDLQAICCSVTSEGGLEDVGVDYSASRFFNLISINAEEIKPIIAIRLKSGSYDKTIDLKSFSVISTSDVDFYWDIRINPDITDDGAASWVSAGDDSYIEYDITRSGTISSGTILQSGYVNSQLPQKEGVVKNLLTIAAEYDGTPDEFVLCVGATTVNDSFYGSLNWIEE